MKRSIFSTGLILLMAMILDGNIFAGGKPFEGILTYKISYPDSKFTEGQLSMFPKTLTVSVKGLKSRAEVAMSMGSQVTIMDYEAKSKIMLIDMMGQKYAVKSSAEEIEKEITGAPKASIELSSETKMIAGYLCKKAIVTVVEDGVKTSYVTFYTNELGGGATNFDNPVYKDIDGVLMEYTLKSSQVNMSFTVTSVEKKSVSPKLFEIPSEYTITTEEELKSKFGGGGE